MQSIETSITINTTPAKAWKVLMDFENYPNWNPFIKSIAGAKRVGGQLTVRIQPPEQGGMTFKPTVISLKENEEFSWLGKLMFKGIFDGQHHFRIADNKDGTITFHHGETFSGILVSLFAKTLEKTKDGFERMNQAFKADCEG